MLSKCCILMQKRNTFNSLPTFTPLYAMICRLWAIQAELGKFWRTCWQTGQWFLLFLLHIFSLQLISCSIKFTSNGYVRLSTKILEEVKHSPIGKSDSKKSSSLDKQQDTYAIIYFEVEDTGIGIQEDVRKRLFQPFGQADSSTARKFGGSG